MSEPAIQDAMQAAQIFLNNTAERRRYINREMAIMDKEAQLEYATEKGQKQGENRMGKLMSFLLSQGRTEEALKASSDEAFRNKMYRQYGL